MRPTQKLMRSLKRRRLDAERNAAKERRPQIKQWWLGLAAAYRQAEILARDADYEVTRG